MLINEIKGHYDPARLAEDMRQAVANHARREAQRAEKQVCACGR